MIHTKRLHVAAIAAALCVASSALSASAGLASIGATVAATFAGAPASPPSTSQTVARPSYNNGNGFFVLDGVLYDATGFPFVMRGVNRNHWDSSSELGIVASGANTVRWAIDFTRDAGSNVALLMAQSINHGQLAIAGNWVGTCNSDPAVLQGIVATWVAQAAQWTALNGTAIVNIANEWGPGNSIIWRDSYISAIAALRAAGYTMPLLIDAGGCGQDDSDLAQYAQAVFDADPERNIVFDLHEYGGTNDLSATIKGVTKGHPTIVAINSTAATHPFAPSFNGANNSYSGITAFQISGVAGMTQLNGMQAAPTNVGGTPGAWTLLLSADSSSWPDYTGGGTAVDYNGNYLLKAQRLATLSRSTGAAFVIGEFGPGRNIGPSPTLVTPAEVITAANANGVGWLAWAWDDNDLAACTADDNWFDMQYGCGTYTKPSDLTIFGKDVVLNPTYGLAVTAQSHH